MAAIRKFAINSGFSDFGKNSLQARIVPYLDFA
jgi:hypothetical protein